jgi:4-hydroxybenzoate polyprenyltransferase
MIIKDIISLIRVKQWYKNLMIFLPLIFAVEISNMNAVYSTVIGFFAFSFISSVNYILNDIADIKKDRVHPEKKHRPLASGRITKPAAIFLGIALVATTGFITAELGFMFRIILVLFFILTQLYTLILKNEAFADIIMISVNFVLRAVAGTFVLSKGFEPYLRLSPWLILCPFFLAMFLAVGKREADLRLLGDKAKFHKKVFKVYTLSLTNTLMIISTTLLIISYALYSFLSVSPGLIITIPAALYCIFRYFHLVESGSEIARHPDKAYKDKRLVIGALVWGIMIFSVLYLM